jgi:hypothetical protein
MKKIILISIVILALLGCNKNKFDSIPHGYYTMEYYNWAWGYSHSGWIIDKGGDVMSFNLPDSWQNIDSTGHISEADLIENISNCDSKTNEISKSTLYKYNKLIDQAADGTISEPVNVGNDAGGTGLYCYQYNADLGLYKRVLLDVEGDWRYHNESSQAKTITKWLK